MLETTSHEYTVYWPSNIHFQNQAIKFVCPYCGYEDTDHQKYIHGIEKCGSANCINCGKKFQYVVHYLVMYLTQMVAGTKFVCSGAGSTVRELDDAASKTLVDDELAALHLIELEKKYGPEYHTNLILTGEELNVSDMERITECE